MRTRILGILSIVLAAAGVFVAASLSLAEARNGVLPCGAGSGCAAVARDPHSMLFGFPVAYFGLAAYLFLAFTTIAANSPKIERRALVAGFSTALVGTVFSGYLTLVSVTQIHATCIWCLTSAAIMAALLLLHAFRLGAPPSGQGSLLVAGVLGGPLVAGALAGAFILEARIPRNLVNEAVLRTTKLADLAPPGAHVSGADDAPVTIVEFADFACPACRTMHGRLTKLLSDFKGVRLVYHHQPMSTIEGHEASVDGANCSEMAAARGLFSQFSDLAFAGPTRPTAQDYDAMLTKLGVPGSSAHIDASAKKRVQDDRDLANRLGVRMTPTFIVFSPDLPPIAATNLDLGNVLERPEILAYLRH